MSNFDKQAQELKKIAERLNDIQLELLPLHLQNERVNGLVSTILTSAANLINHVGFYLP